MTKRSDHAPEGALGGILPGAGNLPSGIIQRWSRLSEKGFVACCGIAGIFGIGYLEKPAPFAYAIVSLVIAYLISESVKAINRGGECR